MRIPQSKRTVHQVDWNHNDDRWEHTCAEDKKEQIIFSSDVESGEGVSRECAKSYRKDGATTTDDNAIQQLIKILGPAVRQYNANRYRPENTGQHKGEPLLLSCLRCQTATSSPRDNQEIGDNCANDEQQKIETSIGLETTLQWLECQKTIETR